MCGELALEEAVELSKDRLRNTWTNLIMERKCSFKTLTPVHQFTRRHIKEDRNPCAIKHPFLRKAWPSVHQWQM